MTSTVRNTALASLIGVLFILSVPASPALDGGIIANTGTSHPCSFEVFAPYARHVEGLDALIRQLQQEQPRRWIVNDMATNSRVSAVFQKLLDQVPDQAPLQVHVITGADLNAFHLSGGIVLITQALVDITADNDDVLASTLAHEIGHFVLNHVSSTNQVGQMLDCSRLGFPWDLQLSQAFAWQQELEADVFASLLPRRAGYSRNSAVDALLLLQSSGAPDQDLRHPPFATRIATSRAALAADDSIRGNLDLAVDKFRAGDYAKVVGYLGPYLAHDPFSSEANALFGGALVRTAESSSSDWLPGADCLDPALPCPDRISLLWEAERCFQRILSREPSNELAQAGRIICLHLRADLTGVDVAPELGSQAVIPRTFRECSDLSSERCYRAARRSFDAGIGELVQSSEAPELERETNLSKFDGCYRWMLESGEAPNHHVAQEMCGRRHGFVGTIGGSRGMWSAR